MPHFVARILLPVLLCLAGSAHAATLSLHCNDPRGHGVETQLIQKLAPGVVIRQSVHELRIKTNNAQLKFIDKPPHDEPFSGVHYHFCDRQQGFILLMEENQDMFTGQLINEATGQITPGGDTVLFSADRRAYFTTEQPDGMDGSLWKIYAVNGKLSWSGYSHIPKEDNHNYMFAALGNPTWTASGEFTAEAQCIPAMEKKWQVKLTKQNGAWDWRPKGTCPTK